MTRNDIALIIDQVPTLNAHGIGLFNHGRGLSAAERDAQLARGREELLGSEESCNKVCDWLVAKAKTKTVNHSYSSYGLKHLAEDEVGYVTNGAFIAAAIYCGFQYKLVPGSPNVLVGISKKSLKV